jgi:AcrR family transcriptional regulator
VAPHADAARNRLHLLASAREMLAEQGADKLTMDGLAERAGLGKGTVFRRFRTRAGIFQAPRHRTASSPTAGPASTS